MATATSLTNTYAGEVAGGYILQAMKAIKSLDFLTVKENINGYQVVRKLVDTVAFGAQTCETAPTGTITLTERKLTLQWFQVQRKLCKTDFNFDWNNSDQPGFPSDLEDAAMANLLAGIASVEETNIWANAASSASAHAGFKYLMLADADVIDVATPTTLSATNIVAELKELLDTSLASAQGAAIHGSAEKPLIYMGVVAAAFYQQAMAALGFNFQYQAGQDFPLRYMNYEIVVCPGMPADTMVMAQKSNLWFGTHKLNQMNKFNIIDLEVTTGDKSLFMGADFAFGLQYGFGNEITLYGT